jgi:L-threonylcarbamoyladenylate synthase
MRLLVEPTEAAALVAAGGLVAFPTETFYGLAVRAGDPRAIERLIAAKGREPGKPVPLIVADADDAARLFELPGDLARLAARFWPGPLTLAARPRHPLHPALLAPDGTAGVRVSSHDWARRLAAAAGGLITATSANLAGGAPQVRADRLDSQLVARLDAVLDGGETKGGAPSTVVALAPDGGFVVLRAGALTEAELRER